MTTGSIGRVRGALTAITLAGQRAVMRTARGPLRPLWAAAYALIARAAAAYLRAGESGATIYLRGSVASGEPLYGLADIDLAIIVPPEPGRSVRRRIDERWRALVRLLPTLGKIVQIKIYVGGEELRRAMLWIRPGLGSPASDWRLIAGDEVRPSGEAAAPDPHLAAWLELQWWWRLCCDACLDPRRRHIAYLCLKLITQSARVRLWLEQGEITSGHTEVLARARATMPDEEDALRKAERLWRELPRSPDPPLADAVGFLLRTTARVADRLASEARACGETTVRLLDAEAGAHELALAPAARAELSRLESEVGCEHVLPLADWRARAPRSLLPSGRAGPLLADQGMAILAADPAEPAELSRLARISDSGLRPAVRWGPLLVLPSSDYFAWLHLIVQFECSDPVSYALLAGEQQAAFPNVSGWSAADCARRTVDEYAFWLQRFPATDPAETGATLGLLLGAARAALFEQSVEREPELAVTAAGAANRLAEDYPDSRTVLEEALGSYVAWRRGGAVPEVKSVVATRRLIERLPAYRSPDGADRFAPVAGGPAAPSPTRVGWRSSESSRTGPTRT